MRKQTIASASSSFTHKQISCILFPLPHILVVWNIVQLCGIQIPIHSSQHSDVESFGIRFITYDIEVARWTLEKMIFPFFLHKRALNGSLRSCL